MTAQAILEDLVRRHAKAEDPRVKLKLEALIEKHLGEADIRLEDDVTATLKEWQKAVPL